MPMNKDSDHIYERDSIICTNCMIGNMLKERSRDLTVNDKTLKCNTRSMFHNKSGKCGFKCSRPYV